MMTFAQRDRRRTIVGDAIEAATIRVATLEATLNALPPDADPLERSALKQQLAAAQAQRTALDTEKTELAMDRWEVSDQNARAVAADWLWTTAANLHAIVKEDLALLALEREPLLTPAGAAAIEALPRAAGDSRPGFLDEVANAVGGDADVMNEVVGTALGRWLRQPTNVRAYPFREIGVMLPLRLETLFDHQPDDTWKLSLRVIPDEPSIMRDQPKVTASEVECLEELWNRSRVMAPAAGTPSANWLDHAEGMVAWERLSDRVSGPRAAWLVAAFPTELQDGAFTVTVPPDRIGINTADRVAGLPPVLDVVAVTLNGQEHHIGTLSPDQAALTLPLPASRDEAFESWLISWTKAKAVGMGGEFALPPGCTPDTIKALYVWGIGDESPAAQFSAHADAGVMGLLRIGAPTNTVQGAPAADLARDRETWRRVAVKRLRGERDSSVDAIGSAVCGDGAALRYVPGASGDINDTRRLVQALWPALWGHYFRDLWNCADDGHVLGLWAAQSLHPEGPLLPLRIATQPYGLLPVTSLERWQPSGATDIDQIETRIVKALIRLRPGWVSAAEDHGTIVGADARRLLELLARTGVSARYVYRPFLPAAQLAAAYPAVPQADFVAEAERAWRSAADVLRHEPSRAYLAIGHSLPLQLPLVGARRMPPDLRLEKMFEALYTQDVANVFLELMRSILPDSLLLRLLAHSVLLMKAWYVQSAQGAIGPLLNALRWDDPPTTTPLENFQPGFVNAEQNGLGRGPVANLLRLHQKAVFDLAQELEQHRKRGRDPLDSQREVSRLVLPPERLAELERALRATLDTAGHRIDPWATGVAWRRLRQHAASPRRLHRLGAYGWLDGPFLGVPGPNRAGRLHAPSHTQALTSIILRDKFLSSDRERTADDRNIWKMDLTSTRVRLAFEMTEEVRMGFHIFEVVGRRVEGIIGRPDRVRAIRSAAPLRPDKPNRADVCHGLNALEGLLADTIPGVLIIEQRVRQLAELKELKGALEVYSDLLIAEGVHQVVTGHADIAAEVMDAAAGFSRPPAFEFLRTPPSGYRLATSVIAVMPHRPPVENGTPIELVDASLAALLEDRFGNPDPWSWRAEWKEEVNGVEVDLSAVVTLAELSLDPLGIVLVPEDFLIEAVRTKLGAESTPRGRAKVTSPPAHRLIRQMAGILGARPAALPDVAPQSDLPEETQRQSENAQRLELFQRYERARTACAAFAAEIGAAGVTDAQRVAWLRRALGWGLVGPATPELRKALLNALFGEAETSPDDLLTLTQAGIATLTARLNATPAAEDPGTARLPVTDLALALAQIASPDGKLTITARWSTESVRDISGVKINAAEANLDQEWLSVVAAVRPALARLETLQLEASILNRFEPLSAWTNSPGDSWQTGLVAQNVDRRRGAGGITSIRTPRFVATYGPAGVWLGADVAVALVDQFSEAVPM
ncbi:MAG: hypothetical protein ACREVZ_00430, partial [Burkholderiales bacterium]